MYRNKHTFFKRALYRVQDIFPPSRNIKALFRPFRVASFARRLQTYRQEVAAVREKTGHSPLFTHVEIETINRCNGECGFCPVNRHLDSRPLATMPEELFRAIITQLHDLDYAAELCLYSNNESLMDTRIEEFTAHARREVPRARIMLSSNGTLLTPQRYQALIDNVDLFYINNYCSDFKLTSQNEKILQVAQSRPDWWEKTHIVVRYNREIMSNRGGQAPNKNGGTPHTLATGCTFPATQLIIRPDGSISLCCNDATGKYTLRDLTQQSLTEAWWSDSFEAAREQLLHRRNDFSLCCNCDTLGD